MTYRGAAGFSRLFRPTGLVLGLSVAFCTASSARAEFVLHLGTPINGVTPQGDLEATFKTVVAGTSTTDGKVRLTVNAGTLVGDEYVASLGFNITPGYFTTYPSSLQVTRTGGSSPSVTEIGYSIGDNVGNLGNNVKAGLFDIAFSFGSSNSERFAFPNTLVFEITGRDITENSFNFLSGIDDKGKGGWLAAADIRAIPTTGPSSGSVGTKTGTINAVPEPSSLVLSVVGAASIGLMAFRRPPATPKPDRFDI